MKRIVQTTVLTAVLVTQIAPALTLNPSTRPNCDLGPKSEWVRCFIEHTQQQGTGG